MKSKSAFSIVEVLVIVVIITILSGISVLAYNTVQRDSRDFTRKGNAVVISEALEKFYNTNGEYPSVRSLVNTYADNTGPAVAAKLKVSPSDLLMPRLPAGVTNPLTTNPAANTSYITYVAKSASNDTACQTIVTGGCDEFTLKYTEESGKVVTIESRRKGRSNTIPVAPQIPSDIADNFNRTGPTLGSTSTGNVPWVSIKGAWKTNGAKPTTSSAPNANPFSVVVTNTADADFSIDANGGDALYARVVDANNWVRLRLNRGTGSYTTTTPVSTPVYTTQYQWQRWVHLRNPNDPDPVINQRPTFISSHHLAYMWWNSSTSAPAVRNWPSLSTSYMYSSMWPPGTCNCGRYYLSDTNYSTYTGATRSIQTGTTTTYQTSTYTYTYYQLILDKNVAGTITTLQSVDLYSPPNRIRLVIKGNQYGAYYGSAANTPGFNYTDVGGVSSKQFGFGRASTSEDYPMLDNFNLKSS